MPRIFAGFEKCYPKRDIIANEWAVKLLYCVRPWTKKMLQLCDGYLFQMHPLVKGLCPPFPLLHFANEASPTQKLDTANNIVSDVYWSIVIIYQMTILQRYSKLRVNHAVSPSVRIKYMPWLFERVNAWPS